jgi:hypothetical protein
VERLKKKNWGKLFMANLFSRMFSAGKRNLPVLFRGERKKAKPKMPKIDVGQLRADLFAAYQDPVRGRVLRQQWLEKYPLNHSVKFAFNSMIAYQSDPKRRAVLMNNYGVARTPEQVLEQAKMSVDSYLHSVVSTDAEIRAGRFNPELFKVGMNKRYVKRALQQRKRDEASSRRVIRLFEEVTGKTIRTLPKEKRERAEEIKHAIWNHLMVSDAMNDLMGLKKHGFMSEEMLKESEERSLKTFSDREAKDIGEFSGILINEILIHEKERKLSEPEIRHVFDHFYHRFLELRLVMSREEYMEKMSAEMKQQKLLG